MTGMNKEDEQMNPEFPRGLKWTRQRKRVYEILSQAAEPLNAAQIYQLAEKGGEERSMHLPLFTGFWRFLKKRGWWRKRSGPGTGPPPIR